MKYTLLLFILAISLASKEVSVFGAGDINSDKPYGLNNAEKAAYKNKQKIIDLNKKLEILEYKLSNTNSKYTDLNERLQGISSVYENDSENLNKTKKNLNKITNSIETTNVTIEKLKQLSLSNSDNLIALEKRLDKFIDLQNSNNTQINSLLNKINKNYISKKQFDELVSFVNGNNKIKKKKITKKSKTNKLSNKQKLAHAISMFKKRYFTKSIPIWNELLESNYMPATVNYYLGEVRFAKKQYKKAIHNYKTSMILYDEADYIPNLLLHSAISFEKIDDKENAINFYNTLIEVYSSSKEAKIAKKQISKLK